MVRKIQGVPKNMNIDGEEKRKAETNCDKKPSRPFSSSICAASHSSWRACQKKFHHDDGDDDDNVEDEKEEERDGLVICVFGRDL